MEAKVCLAFPDIYDIGMSHLGFKILYKILNDDPRTLAERCYAPWVDMEQEIRARGLPLVSLESARPLADFDVIGFSLQFELTYTNVLNMLDLGGVPLRAADRGDDHPLVLGGGPDRHPPRAARSLHRRVRDRRRRGEGHRGRPHLGSPPPRGRAPARSGSSPWPRLGAVYVPSLLRDRGRPRHRPHRGHGPHRPPGFRSRSSDRWSTSTRLTPSPTSARSAGPRPSSTACRSRSRAAAPRAAASARPE